MAFQQHDNVGTLNARPLASAAQEACRAQGLGDNGCHPHVAARGAMGAQPPSAWLNNVPATANHREHCRSKCTTHPASADLAPYQTEPLARQSVQVRLCASVQGLPGRFTRTLPVSLQIVACLVHYEFHTRESCLTSGVACKICTTATQRLLRNGRQTLLLNLFILLVLSPIPCP
jgi:hypothetical protein